MFVSNDRQWRRCEFNQAEIFFCANYSRIMLVDFQWEYEMSTEKKMLFCFSVHLAAAFQYGNLRVLPLFRSHHTRSATEKYFVHLQFTYNKNILISQWCWWLSSLATRPKCVQFFFMNFGFISHSSSVWPSTVRRKQKKMLGCRVLVWVIRTK